jgi:hypothetical protein
MGKTASSAAPLLHPGCSIFQAAAGGSHLLIGPFDSFKRARHATEELGVVHTIIQPGAATRKHIKTSIKTGIKT